MRSCVARDGAPVSFLTDPWAWWVEPFVDIEAMRNALWAVLLTAVCTSLVGTWVVLRGMSFLGDALAHGVLPGHRDRLRARRQHDARRVRRRAGDGGRHQRGAVGVAAARRRLDRDPVRRLPQPRRRDHEQPAGGVRRRPQPLPVRLDHRRRHGRHRPPARRDADHRRSASSCSTAPCSSSTFDERQAAMLGLRPRLTHIGLLVLLAVAIVASFSTVGNLLVFAFLVAPPATATLFASRVPAVIAAATVLGAVVGRGRAADQLPPATPPPAPRWRCAPVAAFILVSRRAPSSRPLPCAAWLRPASRAPRSPRR